MLNETITAISTPHGKGGVSMIRISGENALTFASSFFHRKSKNEILPRVSYYGEIVRDGVVIDDGTLTYYKAPYSFTGEDVCEICCHGGLYLTQAVLECALASGCQMAGPGEFTKRAFLNGKMTLSEAEAVGLAIDAKTDAQMLLSSSQKRGVLSERIEKIRQKMLKLLGSVWASIDYPEEDVPEVEKEQMARDLTEIEENLNDLKKTYRTGKAVCEGITTAIIGKPNVGKSSLYNLLVGENLAIVTDIAGTTRDVIEHTVALGDITLRLADTAGIHETADTVEQIGVSRAKEQLKNSELLFCVFDTSRKEDAQDEFILSCAEQKNAIMVLNKNDRENLLSDGFVKKIKKASPYVVSISAQEPSALQTLGDCVKKIYNETDLDVSKDALITSARVFASVSVSVRKVQEAKEAFADGQTNDVICFALESAMSELGGIDMRESNDEIISDIFSRFCVGK